MDEDPAQPEPVELEELVVRAIARVEDEGLRALVGLCEAHPEHADALQRRVRRLLDTGLVEPKEAAGARAFPERLGDFRLIEPLGGGGMGVVYRAEQESLGREVALKLVRPEQVWFPGARERFQREVEIVAGLQHPGIVPVYAVGEDDGVPFFAMERVRGATLGDVLAALDGERPDALRGADVLRALPAAEDDGRESACALFDGDWTDTCARIGRELAEALEHAHRRGVVHRDVKPSNAMVTAGGRVMLFDFGLSSAGYSDRLTRTGHMVGSLPYMSPEQVRGGELDARTDVYSIGVTLYELLALRLPFEHESSVELGRRIAAGGAPPLRERNSRVSWELETVVETAMDPDPERRYASAADLARDLGNVLAARPIEARRAGAALRARRWVQRHPTAAVGAALGFVALVVAPSVIAWRERRAAREIGVREAQVQATNRRLEETNEELTASNAALGAALDDAHTQRARAEENLDRALEAVDVMLQRVGEEELASVPLMEGVRRELVAEAVRFYEEFLAQRADDPELLELAARASFRLARLYGQSGRFDDAGREVARYADLAAALVAAAPDDVSARAVQAASLRQRSVVENARGRFAEADALSRRALELLEGLPEDADVVEERAWANRDLARTLSGTGRVAEARAALEAAVADWRRLFELRPEHDTPPYELAVTLDRLAALLRDASQSQPADLARGMVAEAREHQEESVRLVEALHARKPADKAVRVQLLRSVGNLGMSASQAGEWDVSEPLLSRAIELGEGMVRDYPQTVRCRADLGVAWLNLGYAHAVNGRHDEALECFRRCDEVLGRVRELAPDVVDWHATRIACVVNLAGLAWMADDREGAAEHVAVARAEIERFLAANPGNPAVLNALRTVGWTAIEVALEARDPDQAARDARWILASNPAPDQVYAAAWSIGRCAELAREMGRDADADAWDVEAVDLLERALEAGGTTPEEVRGDADLDYLRSRPGAEEVLARGAPGN